MRLDKFLKVSRLIKRRTLAKEVCDQGRVQVNGRVAKAGSELQVGDILTLDFGQRVLKVRVERLQDSARKEEAELLYTVLDDMRVL
ncbi:MAG TPA: RNA-binding S4 domain-containing protein [Firmicutes bacterium]|jgi:ribosomal 50S subunit-recycling heat shock protein|nr:RNA-binding S4 domain-containing protein [Bacillota bacterium]